MNIKEVSKLLDMTESSLRFYEERFKLNIEKNSRGHRKYSEKDLEILKSIKGLKATSDLDLDAIAKKLNLSSSYSKFNSSELKVNEIEKVIKDSQQYVVEIMKNELSSVVELSEKYSKATYEIGKLQEKCSSYEEKLRLISDNNIKDINSLKNELKEKDAELQKLKQEQLKRESETQQKESELQQLKILQENKELEEKTRKEEKEKILIELKTLENKWFVSKKRQELLIQLQELS